MLPGGARPLAGVAVPYAFGIKSITTVSSGTSSVSSLGISLTEADKPDDLIIIVAQGEIETPSNPGAPWTNEGTVNEINVTVASAYRGDLTESLYTLTQTTGRMHYIKIVLSKASKSGITGSWQTASNTDTQTKAYSAASSTQLVLGVFGELTGGGPPASRSGLPGGSTTFEVYNSSATMALAGFVKVGAFSGGNATITWLAEMVDLACISWLIEES